MASSSTNPSRSVTDNGGVHQLPLPNNLETLKKALEQQRTENKRLHMLLEVTAKENAYLQAAQKQFLHQKNIDITEMHKLRSELQQLRNSLEKKNEDLKWRKQIKLEIDDERQTLIDQKMKLCSEINQLTDEREELIEKHTKEREVEAMYSAKLVSAIKTIAANAGFVESGENISDGYLGRLQVHVQNQLKGHSEEKEELERRRSLMNSMFKMLQKEQRKSQEGNAQQSITVSSTSTDQPKPNQSQVSSEPRPTQIPTSSKITTQTSILIKKEQLDEFDSGVTGATPPSLTDLVESSSPVNPIPTDTLSTSKNSTSPCHEKHIGPSRPTGKTTFNSQKKIPDNDVTVTAVTTEEPLLSSIPIRKLGFKGKQLTKFAVTSKPHGIYPNTRVFYCLCGSGPFGSRQNLLLHIAKMTKEWKYQCETCKYYFFYPADLKVHCKTSKCKPKPEITSVAQNPVGDSAQFSSPQATFIEELIGIPTTTTEARKHNKILPRSSLSMGNLQRKILKRHAPWNKDPVEGLWYCTCQKAYKTKHSLETHILTFTKDSKFKCRKPGCNADFLYLGQLKQHLKIRHNVKKPLNGFSSGCHVCGKKFPSRRDLFAHQKTDHGYIRHRTQTRPQWLPTSTMSPGKLDELQMGPRPKLAPTRPNDKLNLIFQSELHRNDHHLKPQSQPQYTVKG